MRIDLGPLQHGPHAGLIHAMAQRCADDPRIQAIWVGGSLAAGTGDVYSDVDFRIAVEPGTLGDWTSPDWGRCLPLPPCGNILLRFGERALLHHMVLEDGSIVDFYVQDTQHEQHEPNVVVLAARTPALRVMLEGFARPAAALVSEIDGATVRQFLVDYWITTHKQMKALGRHYDLSPFAGLYLERMALLRALFMRVTGRDIDARMSLHMLGALHKGLAGALTARQLQVLGAASTTPQETVAVITIIRDEVAVVGRWLADKHGFSYPQALEAVVQRMWRAQLHAAGQ